MYRCIYQASSTSFRRFYIAGLGTVSSFLQRNKFRYQVHNYKAKPRYVRTLATMLLKDAREFSCYLMHSHTRASKSKQSCKTTKE